MIDFHFSDTWADPANQVMPAAWKDYSFDQLKAALSSHVTTMMNKLKAYNIEPEWVQIGNETRNGMMYQAEAGGDIVSYGGYYNNGAQFATLVNAGYDAVKAVFPDSKVIVHIDSGNQWNLYTRIFGNLKTNGGKYDIIGISLYPDNDSWSGYIDDAVGNIQNAYTTYGKDVMVVEFGMDYDQADACKSAITKLMTDGTATGHLAGIFYWEPEAPNNYNGGYRKGCFDGGKPTVALDAFK
jgi:arabinogalactan endo-1,4-beta-galactosidase